VTTSAREETPFQFWASETALTPAGDGYFGWLDHIWPAARCVPPVRLSGEIRTLLHQNQKWPVV